MSPRYNLQNTINVHKITTEEGTIFFPWPPSGERTNNNGFYMLKHACKSDTHIKYIHLHKSLLTCVNYKARAKKLIQRLNRGDWQGFQGESFRNSEKLIYLVVL